MSTQFLTTVLFLSVVGVTIAITFWASRQTKTAADFYSGGRSFSGFQNGLAIGGDYMSAASFLGISGAIAIYGYDGFLYSIGFLVAWLVALLLVAEMLRNAGRYTMADQLAFRMRQRPVRTAASISTVVVSIFYLLAQMVGAGTLVALLLGVDSQAVQNITIVGVGILMIFYVVV
ncbi:MAG: solute symporter family protein, partial [Nocardioides sp.]